MKISHLVASLFYAVGASLASLQAMANTSSGNELPVIPLAQIREVTINHGGYGSDAFIDPKNPSRFYVLTDRGPNADAIEKGTKIFPVPNYTPSIGYFQIEASGKVTLLKEIPLRRPDGQKLTGLPNPEGMGSTGEKAIDMQGQLLNTDEYGIDSEGLVVDGQGNFWVSDEYGPHIVRFNAEGIEQERMSPMGVNTKGRKLPAVLAKRTPNRGMEGLSITPDGKTLVGIMQSTLSNPSKKEVENKTLTRIITFELETGKTKQYLYQQNGKNFANSAIIALGNNKFLVDERDGKFLQDTDKNVQKHVYLVDVSEATDVSGDVSAPTGLLVNGKTLEQTSWEELAKAGIKPATKKLVLDLVAQNAYPHDKFEGMWLIGQNKLAVINDDDFGIMSDKGEVVTKRLPATGKIDKNTVYIYDITLPQ